MADMRVNISKSKFFVVQIQYLRYWITRRHIQPIRNKVELNVFLNTELPKTRKEDRITPFLLVYSTNIATCGLQKRSSSQIPLTSLTSSKIKFEWHSSHQQAFDKIKKVIGTDIQVLLYNPEFNKAFHLIIDELDHQLGAVIMQNKKPISFSSQKLDSAQKRYTTTENPQELLSVIET
jgi:hypothetical protein